MIRQLKQSEIAKMREQILNDQEGICPLCNNPIPEGTACLDHEHRRRIRGSGQLRAVLCRNCNTFLGKLENNSKRCNITLKDLPKVLRRTSKYLLKEHKPFIHPSEREKTAKLNLTSYNNLRTKYKGRGQFPDYPKSGTLTRRLKELFEKYQLEPEFYSSESGYKTAMKKLAEKNKKMVRRNKSNIK